MAKKITNIQLLESLMSLNKPYFTVADLEKVLNVKESSIYITLKRLVDKGVLVRLKQGVYQPQFQNLNLKKVANELYYPSYLSFESALSSYGILSQIPYTLTFATTKLSKKITLADKEIEYRQLKEDYFFGYILKNNFYLAEPEKAILDQLYLISKGKASSNINEWSLVNVNKKKLLNYAKKFPSIVQKNVNDLFSPLSRSRII